ncbi:S41 family peptidase [Vampirovibrio sp.]|uniref:S41 family peptidase n=1 Tax=Vampirovibrio sp. TaxID=2717857 RepID=UPI0035939C17
MNNPGSLSTALKIPAFLKRAGIFTFIALFSTSISVFSGCNLQKPATPSSAVNVNTAADKARVAEQLYDEAWTMVRTEYVDGSFNGQDWSKWRYKYQGKLKDTDDAYVAIGTMVASLNDEYTRFLQPRDMNEQSMSIDSRLYGVGIQISKRDNKLLVLATIDDTPAQRAGLMPKDQITHINGIETAGMSVEDAADQIRGEKGTFVTLSIKRGNDELLKQIERDEIKIKSVFTKPMDDPQVGYIRLSSFISENMLDEMKDSMKDLTAKQALIIDLRGNYGGLFSNAVEIADMFLESGDIVSIVNRERDRRVYSAHPGTITEKPVVVLIDGGSASASEILAGALKDNHRATLIGSQSFGKGLVQKINTLSNNSGMNITISKYLTPNGTDINKKGIEPNVKAAYTEADYLAQRDPQLDRAMQFLKNEIGK